MRQKTTNYAQTQRPLKAKHWSSTAINPQQKYLSPVKTLTVIKEKLWKTFSILIFVDTGSAPKVKEMLLHMSLCQASLMHNALFPLHYEF